MKLRKQTQRDIIRAARRTPNGDFVCACSGAIIPAKRHPDGTPVLINPATGRPSPTGMTIPQPRTFHFGHQPGMEWRKYKREAETNGYDRARVIADQNQPDRYQIETPEANQSHRCEQPDYYSQQPSWVAVPHPRDPTGARHNLEYSWPASR